jgi:hypothetical protein
MGSSNVSQKPYEITVSLAIEGFDCPPEEITSILGIKPTSVVHKGEPGKALPHKAMKNNIWKLQAEIPSPNEDFEVVVQSILGQIEPSIDRFSNLPPAEISLVCVLYLENESARPYVGLTEKAIGILAKIGASFEMNIH